MLFFSEVDAHKCIEIKHDVLVKHPGEVTPIELTLTEFQNKDSITTGYAMNVESVICLENVCKVIPVTLFWNDIGVYQKYTLPKEATLEKYEADLFEPEDYKKLNSILANESSPFKDVQVNDVVKVVSNGDEGVDAVSGATAIELDEKDTVPGAALTCYTLWHWANGDIVNIIKKTTAKASTSTRLLVFLSRKNKNYYHVALEELAERNNYNSELIETVIESASKNKDLIKSSINYLEKAPINIYKSSLKSIFVKGDKLQRIAVVRSLQYYKKGVDKKYLDSYGEIISYLKSFQEVSVFLGLMEGKNRNSEVINKSLVSLLDEDFLIARRVYWFLSEQNNLNEVQQHKMKSFFEKYASRL